MAIIKDNPNINKKNLLWNYCIQEKIYINETGINNNSILINNGFGISGYILNYLVFSNKMKIFVWNRLDNKNVV